MFSNLSLMFFRDDMEMTHMASPSKYDKQYMWGIYCRAQQILEELLVFFILLINRYLEFALIRSLAKYSSGFFRHGVESAPDFFFGSALD